MAVYGYARDSTIDQDLKTKNSALKAAGCEVIGSEKVTGARRDGLTGRQSCKYCSTSSARATR